MPGMITLSSSVNGAARNRYLLFPAPSLPQDFPVRLGRLEDRSGISLEEVALAAGLPARRGRLWRIGRPPSEDELRAIVEFACAVPGGVAVLLLDASQPWPVRE